MKMKLLLTLLLLSFLPQSSRAQIAPLGGVTGGGGPTLAPGWTYQQMSGPYTTGTGCTVGNSACTFTIFSTVTGSVWAVSVLTQNNITISSVSGGGGTWATKASSGCHVWDSTNSQNLDTWYNTSGNSGTTSITVTMSGNTSGSFLPMFTELLPPSGYNGSFDDCATKQTASCSTACTMAAPNVSGTDAILRVTNPQYGGLAQGNEFQCGTKQATFLGSGGCLGLNVTTNSATFNQTTAGYYDESAISFKSTAGSFSVKTPFSFVHAPNNTTFSCTPGCPAFTVPSTTAGDLLLLGLNNRTAATNRYITAVTDNQGSSWAIPTQCQHSSSTAGSVSCAYTLSAKSGVTSITVTTNTTDTYWWMYDEISPTTGVFVPDAIGAGTNTASLTPPGVALTLSGSNDVIFQSIEANDVSNPQFFTQTLYWQPNYGGGSNGNTYTWGSSAVLLNTTNGSAPKWSQNSSVASVANAMAFNTINPGWTYLQYMGTRGGMGQTCTANTSTCTFTVLPTTAGSVWVVGALFANSSATISATHGWTQCPASSCHLIDNTNAEYIDSAYQLSGAAGTTSITVDYSAASATALLMFSELLPPAGYTASFDGAATLETINCTTSCAMATPTISGTDGVVHNIDEFNCTTDLGVPSAWSPSDYYYSFRGCHLSHGLNVTSGTTNPTFNQGPPSSGNPTTWDSAISFKTTAPSFSPTPFFRLVQAPTTGGLGTTATCSPSCTFTVPSMGSGNLVWIQMNSPSGSDQHISSVTGGGTWTVDAGCKSFLAAVGTVSCAYLKGATGSTTSITVTMSASTTYFIDYMEISRSSGSWTVDAVNNSTSSSSTTTPSGQTLTLVGTNDACFQGIQSAGLPVAQSLYDLPTYGGFGANNNTASYGSGALLLNTVNGSAPVWYNATSSASAVYGLCFK